MSSSGSGGQPQGGSGGTSAGGTNGGNPSAGAQAVAGSGGMAGGGAGGAGGAGAAAGGSGGGAGGAAGGAGGGGAAGTSGAAGMSGAAGAGGQAPYNPCPATGVCKIMPLGDSITDGAGSSHGGSYRVELFHLANVNNKALTFVGSHESGPNTVDNKPFPKKQEGHSGWTIDDGADRQGLYDEIENWIEADVPHIVTLMIGTNDVDLNLDLNNAPMRLGLLLDRIAMSAPNALIVLAQIVPTTNDTTNQRVQTYNAAMPALVEARADAGKHIILVDMYGAYTANANYKSEYMNDALHPKDAGFTVMANVWYDAIGNLLPPAP
jgi:lysophospholipase L1-like esterase